MGDTLAHLIDGLVFSGNLAEDVSALFYRHRKDGMVIHVALVAERLQRIALQERINMAAAYEAAWLHDAGKVVLNVAMVAVAEEYGVEVLPEERAHPGILHGKLSAVVAERMFRISDPLVLDAIRCHTTRRANATALDKALFVPDKLSWHRERQIRPTQKPFDGVEGFFGLTAPCDKLRTDVLVLCG
jgi:HD superfamily phosphohydrolase YqeK